MKKRMFSLVLAMVMVSACIPVSAGSSPAEVAAIGDPAEAAAEYLVEQGIMAGYADGSLGLDRAVTRAEFAKMAVLLFALNGEADSSFPDVARSHWAYSYIEKAAGAGIIGGFEDGTFRPEKNVTYEQAVKMVMEALGNHGQEYPVGYWSQALDAGVMENVPAIIGKAAVRGDIALMLYNTVLSKQDEDENRALEQRAQKKAEQARLEEAQKQQEIPDSSPQQGQEGDVPKYDSGAAGGSGADPSAPTADAPGESSMPPSPMPSGGYGFNTEEYTQNGENGFKNVQDSPVSTFSVDVDTASYSNMRRFLLNGRFPTPGSIRSEELINYFSYDLPLPTDGTPFSVTTELQECPWNPANRLAMIALKGDEIPVAQRKPSNLVFLIDVSGSMFDPNKLPLVQRSMKLLVQQLDSRDKVSVVTYAGSTRILLEGANGEDKEEILDAIFGLEAYGSTAGAAGIDLAYQCAEENRVDGNNRIILCTDGDFNVGPSSTAELEKLIEEKRQSGIFLSVLGFGMGNYKDNRMETLADKGDGNYAYIDNLREAKKVLVDDMMKTLYTIAKDVKLQVEFNPETVKQYRLIGYENRLLQTEDFDDDTKDAGEIGAGHEVIAFYELVPADGAEAGGGLRYQDTVSKGSDELMYVKLRYKKPTGGDSQLIERAVGAEIGAKPSESFVFASAVAQLGMFFNQSEFLGNTTLSGILERAASAIGEDPFGLRAEFVQLASMAQYLE